MSHLPTPRRDPTAREAVMHVLRDEARARRIPLAAYLRQLTLADADGPARTAAERLRAQFGD
jgi:hypothetical protein